MLITFSFKYTPGILKDKNVKEEKESNKHSVYSIKDSKTPDFPINKKYNGLITYSIQREE
jgi:hypothetical protein